MRPTIRITAQDAATRAEVDAAIEAFDFGAEVRRQVKLALEEAVAGLVAHYLAHGQGAAIAIDLAGDEMAAPGRPPAPEEDEPEDDPLENVPAGRFGDWLDRQGLK